MEKLALFGGEPTLKKILKPYNSLGVKEEKAAAKAVREKVLSGFVGRAGNHFLGGKYVRELEKRFSGYFKVKYSVSFNSATTALIAAVGALGIGPGDEVITSPYTMSATAAAVLLNNAVPVFADINEDDFCLNAEEVRKKINKNTKAIAVVNLFGGPADYNSILRVARDQNLKIIEDNAQSPGAIFQGKFAGTIGDIGVFSLNANKVIQCGEGGVLITNDKKYAFRAQLTRNHGEAVIDDLYHSQKLFEAVVGNNYRLTEIQAAVAVEQFKKLDRFNRRRIDQADYLTKKIRDFNWLIAPKVKKGNINVYFAYPIRFLGEKIGIKRKTFVNAMKAEGFSFSEGYIRPLYLSPIYQKKQIYTNSQFPFVSREYPHKINYKKGICPVAERMYEKELLLTNIFCPPNTRKEIDLFLKALEKIKDNINILKKHEEREK